MKQKVSYIILLIFINIFTSTLGQTLVTGELRQWHKVTLTFTGPISGEQDSTNPFLDYRLNVYFKNGASTFIVPGYYAADGNAHETSDSIGNKWRVHFNPPQTGTWTYLVSFRKGTNIAVSDDSTAGIPEPSLNGITGSFNIEVSNKTQNDLRAHGWLEHYNEHYYKFKGTNNYFIKHGMGSPENFLAYWEFDNTIDHPGGVSSNLPDGLHHYAPHIKDWSTGDATWKDGLGKGIIGAINYISTKGINSMFMLLMNVNGDGREVFPWTSYSEIKRYDVSKLDQWEIAFQHMEQKGIAMHLVFQEAENDRLLNKGDLGIERRLYYREMIARFAHHNAVFWNLGEESNRSEVQHKADAAYFKSHDPYKHPVKVHSKASLTSPDALYNPLLGDPNFDATSLQQSNPYGHSLPIKWRAKSEQAGFKWVIEHDEINGGVQPDSPSVNNQSVMRKNVLWGNLIGGGGGIEWYFGYDNTRAIDDIDCEDFRSRDILYNYGKFAREFFDNFLPFQKMSSMDQLITSNSTNWLFGSHDAKIYAAYLTKGGTATISLPSGNWSARLYNPSTGQFYGNIINLTNGVLTAPDKNDWAFLIFEKGQPNIPPLVNIDNPLDGQVFYTYSIVPVNIQSSDPDGMIKKVEIYIDNNFVFIDSIAPYSVTLSGLSKGSHTILVSAFDDSLAFSSDSSTFFIEEFRNQPPKISILNPIDSAEIQEGSTFPIITSASDPDGNITHLEFYINEEIVFTDSTAPYNYNWINIQSGAYLIKVIAYDDSSASSIDSVYVTVKKIPNAVPLISIISPQNNASFNSPANIQFNITASDTDGSITLIELYENTQVLATSTTSTLNFNWTNVPPGTYTVYAKAYDDSSSAIIDSVKINVTSQPDYLSGFTLINASTDLPVAGFDPIQQNAVINLASTGPSLNIRANTASAGIGSIRFQMDGATVRTENTAPYSLGGDNSGNYNSWTPSNGIHRLKGFAYSQSNGQGILLDTLTITFTVINQSSGNPVLSILTFPNPVENEVNILINDQKDTHIFEEGYLIHLLGKKQKVEIHETGNQSYKIDTSDLVPGIYYIVLVSKDGFQLTQMIRK